MGVTLYMITYFGSFILFMLLQRFGATKR